MYFHQNNLFYFFDYVVIQSIFFSQDATLAMDITSCVMLSLILKYPLRVSIYYV